MNTNWACGISSIKVHSPGSLNLQGKVESKAAQPSAARCLATLFAIAMVIGYFAWVIFGDSLSARESRLHPEALLALAKQISRSQPLSDWNIPWLSLAVWSIWLPGICSLGFLICRPAVRFENFSRSARIVTCFAAGFTLFGLIQLIFGLAGLIKLPVVILPLAIVFAVLTKSPRREWTDGFAALRWRWSSLPRPAKVLTAALLLLFCFTQLAALVPPIQSDGVRYHLGAPQEFLKLGRITWLPLNAYSNMPFLVEMHYLAALVCGAPEASQLMHGSLAGFAALAVYALARQLSGGARSGISAHIAFSYLAIPASAILAAWPFTDHAISFFLVSALLVAVNLSPAAHALSWSIFGLILGGLIGTKYTMAPVALLVWSIPFFIHRHRTSLLIRSGLAGLVTLLAAGIWFAKNLAFTGNPFYPLASSIFPGGDWSAASESFLHARAAEKGLGTSPMAFLLSPWNLTTGWVRFEAHNPGPLPALAMLLALGCATSAILRRTLSRPVGSVLVVAAVSYGIWFFSYQSNRLLLPVVAVLLAALPALLSSAPRCLSFMKGALISACLYGLLWAAQWSLVTTALSPPPLAYITGQIDHKNFRYQSLSNARAYDYLNARVKPDEKVLIVGDYRIYGAHFTALWSDWFDQPALAAIVTRNHLTTTPDLIKWLHDQKVNWVLINDREIALQSGGPINLYKSRFTPEQWQIHNELTTLEDPSVTVTSLAPGVRIYHLGTKP